MKSSFKKLKAGLLCAAVLIGCTALLPASADISQSETSVTAQAVNTVVYDGDKMSTFSSRTPESVAKKYTDAYYAGSTYDDRNSSSYYSTPASTENPYYQGVLSNDTLKCMQEMTNFYRWLVGNKPLKVKCTQNESLQYQALDRCFKHSHWISESDKPDDMPLDLWKKGEQCDHNILAWYTSPRYSITQWMNEGYYLSSGQWGTLGHRYGIINPNHTDIQYGFCGDVALGDYDDFNSGEYPNEAFYAFPSPGYVPADCISPTYSAWSVDFDTRKIKVTDTSAVKVTVTNLSTKTSYECTSSNDKASVSSSSIAFVQPSEYDKSTYNYTDSFKVVITGLTDTATSKAAQVQYTVRFFELKDYAVGSISKAGFDYSTILFYKDSYSTTDSLKKLGAVLPTTVTLTNDFGAAAKVKTKGKWTLDEANKCWYNSVDPSAVPSKFVDTNGLLKKLTIGYESTDDSYDVYNTLSIYPSDTTCGNNVRFSIHRTLITYRTTLLGLIAKDSSGNYYCKKSYDSLTSPEFDSEGSGTYHYYNIKATEADSGEYISLYYYSGGSWDTAYACNIPGTLTVSHNYELFSTKEPTCTEAGSKTYKCSGCGKKKTETIKATGHSWKSPTYSWSSDGKTCTAKRVCANDSAHVESESAAIASKVKTPATCAVKGTTTYTATFKNTAFKTQTKNVQDIALVAHTWGSWTTTKAATCSAKGTKTRTCSVCKKVATADIAINANAHSWQAPTYTWSSDGKTCTAKRVCANDSAHVESESAAIASKVKTPATCAVKGITTYTATFKNTAFKTQTKDVQDIALVAHTWGSWKKTGFDVSAGTRLESRSCKVCKKTENRSIENGVVRLAGKGRYETAVEISRESGTKGDTVVLAYSMNYADALAGVPLAHKLGAPILLNDTKTLDKATLAEIKRIGAKNVIILGGEGAISKEVEKALAKEDLTTRRIAGSTRFSTATAIAEQLNSAPQEVFFVYGFNYADALSVSTVAAVKGAPIIYLSTSGELDHDTADYLAKIKGRVKNAYVIGGEGVISDDMMNKAAKALGLKFAARVAGKDRYLTCVEVNKAFAETLTGKAVCIATGLAFPDALAGGVFAAGKKAPLFLADNSLSSAQAEYLKSKDPDNIYVFGGTGAVPDSLVNTVAKACV